MSKLRFIGLDVHKESIVMALAESGDQPAQVVATLPGDAAAVLRELRRLGSFKRLRVCYEAGPTGYGLQRCLAQAGVDCIVVAPSKTPQVKGTRLKTDRRDARLLAHFLRSGDLTPIWIPDEQTEAIRDLERARDDARLALRQARQQLLKFLLRNGRVFTEGRAHWTRTHWAWIRRQQFAELPRQRVLEDAIRTLDQAQARLQALDEDLAECVVGWSRESQAKDLQAFHGVQLLTATAIIAEIGDFERFPTASKFMAFVGLIPSENSSGQTRRQGRLTRTGNRHVRRLLIEAAWQYWGCRAQAGPTLTRRRAGLSPEVVAIADKALRRLRTKAQRMLGRRKPPTKIIPAIARELAGFVWAAARCSQRLSPPCQSPPARVPRVSG